MMTTRRIGFTLGGDAIPFETFLEAGSRLSALLAEVDSAVSGSQTLEWVISDLRFASATVAVSSVPRSEEIIDQSPTIISSVLKGLETIERTAERPEYFTDEALLTAKRLVSLLNGKVERISIFGNVGVGSTGTVRATQRIAANVDQLLGIGTVAVGSVEGTLETVTIHGGTSFNIYDTITHRRVRCVCDRERLDELEGCLGSRVLVEGEIRYNVQGQPISIKVENHRVLRSVEELPQATDIRGLFSRNKIDTAKLSESLRS